MYHEYGFRNIYYDVFNYRMYHFGGNKIVMHNCQYCTKILQYFRTKMTKLSIKTRYFAITLYKIISHIDQFLVHIGTD